MMTYSSYTFDLACLAVNLPSVNSLARTPVCELVIIHAC